MSAATVSSEGQVTIPTDIRAAFAIRPEDKLLFFKSLSGELHVHISRPRVGAGRGTITVTDADLSRGRLAKRSPPALKAGCQPDPAGATT